MPAVLPDGSEGVCSTDADGVLTVTLQHGQQITLGNLPEGTRYTITETDAKNYTTTFDVTGGSYAEPDGQSLSGTLSEDVTVAVTNDLTVVVPTGVRTELQPFALLLVCGAAAILVMAAGRRRKQKQV
jgi:hypothetical protein